MNLGEVRSLGCQGHQSGPLILSLGTLRPPDSGSPGTAPAPASGQKQITRREHHLDHSSSKGVELPGETHGAVELAPDTLPLLTGWSAPVRADLEI